MCLFHCLEHSVWLARDAAALGHTTHSSISDHVTVVGSHRVDLPLQADPRSGQDFVLVVEEARLRQHVGIGVANRAASPLQGFHHLVRLRDRDENVFIILEISLRQNSNGGCGDRPCC